MGVTMGLFWITLTISILGSNAAGEFSVLHSPQSLKFSGSSKTSESLLKEIYSSSLGLSVEENSEWDGLTITDPFNTPEAVVEVYIDGVSTLGEASGLKSKKYPLIVDEYEPDAYDAIKHRINQRFVNGGNKLVNIRLYDPDDLTAASKVFGPIEPPKIPKHSLPFKYETIDEDYQFLYEIEVFNEITKKIKSGAVAADNIVDFYYIRFRSLHALSDFHGPNSVLTIEAKKLLAQALQTLSDAFMQAYDGAVLVTAVTTDVEHTRRVRAAPELRDGPSDKEPPSPEPPPDWDGPPEGPPTEKPKVEEYDDDEDPNAGAGDKNKPSQGGAGDKNKSPKGGAGDKKKSPKGGAGASKGNSTTYTADFAAIFNIMLWFGIVFVFSLVAIVYAIMDMDPGRDSIIYRMTSTRMKKDN